LKTRREFLNWVAVGGAAMAWPREIAWANQIEAVPKMLDHILLGCADLERGIAWVEERTGVRAEFGGVHPGRGTWNALLSLGERRYLEIIAPDPKQAGTMGPANTADRLGLRELNEPRIATWAVHPGSSSELAERLKQAGVQAEGPTPGSRKRPDGRLLEWKTVNLADDAQGLLPFFIEWGTETVHPSVDAPKGCELKGYWVESPAPEQLRKRLAAMGVEVEVKQADKVGLRARIVGPKGQAELQ
jgi:catechol 2,3-dioxygenase-like lactoylglutathione lyase family enzyme